MDQREERSQHNRLHPLWADGGFWYRRMVDDVYVVGSAGENYFVLLRSLEQTVEQRLVRLDLLLDDSVVHRRLVLRQRFSALLLKCLAQSLFLLYRLPIAGFQISFDHRLGVRAGLLRLLLEHRNLLVQNQHFGIFLGVLLKQLRPMLL